MPSDRDAAALLADGERLHPLTLLFTAITTGRQLVVPALVGGFTTRGGGVAVMIFVLVGILAVPGAIAGVLQWMAFRWRLAGDDLVLRSGVLNRQHRVIPLARIQNVDVVQGPLQRVLGVAELRVETAGGTGQAEATFRVLAASDARALQTDLLAGRRSAKAAAAPALVADGESAVSAPEPPRVPAEVLAKLSTRDVVVAGATASEVGVIAAFVGGAFQFVDDLSISQGLVRAYHATVGYAGGTTLVGLVLVGAGLVVTVLLVGWIISIGGALLRFHGFTLVREGDELRKRYGLLTLHEGSLPLKRVQALRVEESLFRRPLRLATLIIETAGGVPVPGQPQQSTGAEAFVPIAARSDVGRLVRGIFPDLDFDAVTIHRVSRKHLWRTARRYALPVLVPLAIGAGALWWFDLTAWLPALLLPLPLPYLLARWQYAHHGWGLADGYVLGRGGILNRVTWIVPDHKVQTLHEVASPFQRHAGLATVVVDTAAGGGRVMVMDLAAGDARGLVDLLRERVREAARAARRAARAPAPPPPAETGGYAADFISGAGSA